MEKFGGRKFILTLILIAAGILVDTLSVKGISQELVALFVGLITIYGASNAAISMKALKVDSSTSAPDPAIAEQQAANLTELNGTLNQLSQTIEAIGLSSTNTNKLLMAIISKNS